MTSDTSFGPDQMEEGVHAWTSPCNPDPLKPGVKLMAGCNSAGAGVTSVSLPVVNSYVSKTCDKGVKGRRMLLCRVELCDRDEVEVEWGFYALSASKAIFRARTYNCNLFSPVMMIT